jgi:hypothetical protein
MKQVKLMSNIHLFIYRFAERAVVRFNTYAGYDYLKSYVDAVEEISFASKIENEKVIRSTLWGTPSLFLPQLENNHCHQKNFHCKPRWKLAQSQSNLPDRRVFEIIGGGWHQSAEPRMQSASDNDLRILAEAHLLMCKKCRECQKAGFEH